MKHATYIVLFLAFLFAGVSSFAQADIQTASDAYRKGDYKQSIALLEKIVQQNLQQNQESAEVYYNLGNAYFRNGQNTLAILNYERALIVNPSDKDIRHNLRFARKRTVDGAGASGNALLSDTRNSVQDLFSAFGWGILAISMFVITLIVFGLYLFGKKLWLRKIAFYSVFFTLSITIVANIFAFSQKNARQHRTTGIIMSQVAEVKPSPDDNSKSLFQLHEGTKVKIKDSDGNWYQVELTNGNLGWLPKSDIVVI